MRRAVFVFLHLCAALLPCGGALAADLVVVVNPTSGVDRLTRDEVVNIFMGRYRKLGSGLTALPVDSGQREKVEFYNALVGKELAEINGYWARLVFSGQASPPRQTERPQDVLEIVASNKGAIGYVERKLADKRVRIVFSFSQ